MVTLQTVNPPIFWRTLQFLVKPLNFGELAVILCIQNVVYFIYYEQI